MDWPTEPPDRLVRIEYLSCGCVRFRDDFSPNWTDGTRCPSCGQSATCLFFGPHHVWSMR